MAERNEKNQKKEAHMVGQRSRCSLVPLGLRKSREFHVADLSGFHSHFSVLLCKMRAPCAHLAGSEQRERFCATGR
jgi:hypothetical protein